MHLGHVCGPCIWTMHMGCALGPCTWPMALGYALWPHPWVMHMGHALGPFTRAVQSHPFPFKHALRARTLAMPVRPSLGQALGLGTWTMRLAHALGHAPAVYAWDMHLCCVLGPYPQSRCPCPRATHMSHTFGPCNWRCTGATHLHLTLGPRPWAWTRVLCFGYVLVPCAGAKHLSQALVPALLSMPLDLAQGPHTWAVH